MSAGPWLSKDEAEQAVLEAERERQRKELARRPRREIELTPEERKKALVVKDASKFWNVPDHGGTFSTLEAVR